jgi:predicted metal-dependent hydrolase
VMHKTFHKQFSDLGLIEYKLNSKINKISIKIKPFRNISVSVPLRLGIKEADRFLRQKSDWINKNLQEIREYETQVRTRLGEVVKIDESGAKSVLKNRTLYLAEKFAFEVNRIAVKKQRTRWGSCSSKKNINLNINLIHLPDELIDHVILHELVHTRIPDHSSSFWIELAKYSPEPKVKKKMLKNYQYLLYQLRK